MILPFMFSSLSLSERTSHSHLSELFGLLKLVVVANNKLCWPDDCCFSPSFKFHSSTRAAALGACTSAPPPGLSASASARNFATTITKYVLGHSSRCLDAVQLAPSLICSHVSTCRCPSVCAEQLNNPKRTMALTQSMIPLSQTFENLTVSWNERDELLEDRGTC